MKAMYYFTRQANVLEGWTNQAQSAMFDRGKMSEHDETSNGFYIYPSYKFAPWNKLNALDPLPHRPVFRNIKNALRPYASGTANWYTPWFKTAEMSAKYVDVALEDEFKFNTPAGDLRFPSASRMTRRSCRQTGAAATTSTATRTSPGSFARPHETGEHLPDMGHRRRVQPGLRAGVRAGQGHAEDQGHLVAEDQSSRPCTSTRIPPTISTNTS